MQTVRKAFFQNGLQPWARQELRRQNVPDLASAIIAAERMVDEMEKPTHSHKQRGNFFEATKQTVKVESKRKGKNMLPKQGTSLVNLTRGIGLVSSFTDLTEPVTAL